MKLKPRQLLLNLMTVAGDTPLTVQDAVSVCRLFGITENSARVSLTRLSTEGLVQSAGRGCYRLTSRAEELAADVRGWRIALDTLRPWQGHWIGVHTAGLGRTDRAALKRRERALEMSGFRPLEKDLFLRPDNLAGGVAAVRERLQRLGLEAQAPVFLLSGLDAAGQARAKALWDTAALNAGYEDTRREMEGWLQAADELDQEAAARESFVMGDQAIRQMVFDPLLPDSLVDAAARQAFVDTLLRFDRAGQAIWRRLYLGTRDVSSAR